MQVALGRVGHGRLGRQGHGLVDHFAGLCQAGIRVIVAGPIITQMRQCLDGVRLREVGVQGDDLVSQ